jgi:hypothetical protein
VRALFAGVETQSGVRCYDAVRIEQGEVRMNVLREPRLALDDMLRFPVGTEIRRVPLEGLVSRGFVRSGAHTSRGILVAAGAGVLRGVRHMPVQGVQITPTLLAILGIPLARDMDGEPARGLFEQDWLREAPAVDSWRDALPPREISPSDPSRLEDRLRGLGYIE